MIEIPLRSIISEKLRRVKTWEIRKKEQQKQNFSIDGNKGTKQVDINIGRDPQPPAKDTNRSDQK